MTPARHTTPELDALVKLFYADTGELGDFEEVSADQLPAVDRVLLDHDQHMTLTVEAQHGCPVDLRVLDTHITHTHYARKIVLTRQSDGATVQFGIARLNLDFLKPEVRAQIESQQAPLGRILIEHDVLRRVRLLSLWRIWPNAELIERLGLDSPTPCYGRTALIYCDTIPAVELLEIVRPVESIRNSK